MWITRCSVGPCKSSRHKFHFACSYIVVLVYSRYPRDAAGFPRPHPCPHLPTLASKYLPPDLQAPRLDMTLNSLRQVMTKSYLQNHRFVFAGNLLPSGPSASRRFGPAVLVHLILRLRAENLCENDHTHNCSLATQEQAPCSEKYKRADEFLWEIMIH